MARLRINHFDYDTHSEPMPVTIGRVSGLRNYEGHVHHGLRTQTEVCYRANCGHSPLRSIADVVCRRECNSVRGFYSLTGVNILRNLEA